jgi:hypothetical protein
MVSLPKSGKNVWTSEDGSLTVVRGTEVSQVELTLEGHFRTTLTASAHEFPDGHHIDFDVDELNITSECTGFRFRELFLRSLWWAAADARFWWALCVILLRLADSEARDGSLWRQGFCQAPDATPPCLTQSYPKGF